MSNNASNEPQAACDVKVGGLIRTVTYERQGLEPMPEAWEETVLPNDREEVLRVLCAIVTRHCARNNPPTEVRVEAIVEGGGNGVLSYYNCCFYGFANRLHAAEINEPSSITSRYRDAYVSLTAQGAKIQSKGALVVQLWSSDQQQMDMKNSVPPVEPTEEARAPPRANRKQPRRGDASQAGEKETNEDPAAGVGDRSEDVDGENEHAQPVLVAKPAKRARPGVLSRVASMLSPWQSDH